MKLALSCDHWDAIAGQILGAYPAEACGLLTGAVADGIHTVQRIWPADNILAHQTGRFEVDPKQRFLAEKECRHSGQKLIGHWHSHPNGRSQPSETDRLLAFEPDLIWLIVPTDGCRVFEPKAYLPPASGGLDFVPIPLEIE